MTESYRELRRRLDAGETTCAQIVADSFDTILRGSALNAFLATLPAEAAQRAAGREAWGRAITLH